MQQTGCCSRTSKTLGDQFTWSNFSLDYSPADVFYKSQWQKGSRSFWWLLYRWCAAGFFIGVVISATVNMFIGGTFFIYLTTWGIILCMVATTYGAVLSTIWYFRLDVRENSIKTNANLKVFWALHYSALVLAVVISVMFWGVLFPTMPPEFAQQFGLDTYNILIHAFNSIVMILDHMLVPFPTRILHAVYPLGIGFIYMLFSLIYYFAGGTDSMGDHFIYPILNWGGSPGIAVASVVAAILVFFLASFLMYGLYQLRKYFYKQCLNIPSPHMIPP